MESSLRIIMNSKPFLEATYQLPTTQIASVDTGPALRFGRRLMSATQYPCIIHTYTITDVEA